MRRHILLVALLLPATAAASDLDAPREERRADAEEPTRLSLALLGAQWFARAYKVSALTSQVENLHSASLDSLASDSFAMRDGGTRAAGGDASAQTYRAFIGLHRSEDVVLGIEAGGRVLAVSASGVPSDPLEFGGHRFAANQLVTTRVEYASADLDLAFNGTFWREQMTLELRAGLSYLAARSSLRGAIDGQKGEISVEGACPMVAIGLVYRPIHEKLFTLELFARARGGGWPFDTLALGQTEAGVSFIFWDVGGIAFGHRLESAYLDGDPAPRRPANELSPRERVIDKRMAIAAQGPFAAIFLRF